MANTAIPCIGDPGSRFFMGKKSPDGMVFMDSLENGGGFSVEDPKDALALLDFLGEVLESVPPELKLVGAEFGLLEDFGFDHGEEDHGHGRAESSLEGSMIVEAQIPLEPDKSNGGMDHRGSSSDVYSSCPKPRGSFTIEGRKESAGAGQDCSFS
jgi:hypothetical protein